METKNAIINLLKFIKIYNYWIVNKKMGQYLIINFPYKPRRERLNKLQKEKEAKAWTQEHEDSNAEDIANQVATRVQNSKDHLENMEHGGSLFNSEYPDVEERTRQDFYPIYSRK